MLFPYQMGGLAEVEVNPPTSPTVAHHGGDFQPASRRQREGERQMEGSNLLILYIRNRLYKIYRVGGGGCGTQ